MSKVTLDREVITPTIARQYLEANTHNRNLRKNLVQTLAGAIKRGEWIETGDPIKFSNGQLTDGQHRLAAIAESGKRVPVWVARGVSVEAQEVVDTGAKRTVGDMLRLRGYTDGNNLASAATALWVYQTHGRLVQETAPSLRPTTRQVMETVEAEPLLQERVNFARRFNNQDPALPVSRRLVAALSHIFAEVATEEDSAAFFAELITPPSASSPTGLARSRLLRGSAIHARMPATVAAALVIKAWNAWILGEHPARITWRSGGAKKEEFPTIQGPTE